MFDRIVAMRPGHQVLLALAVALVTTALVAFPFVRRSSIADSPASTTVVEHPELPQAPPTSMPHLPTTTTTSATSSPILTTTTSGPTEMAFGRVVAGMPCAGAAQGLYALSTKGDLVQCLKGDDDPLRPHWRMT